jgi:hypothetical protein
MPKLFNVYVYDPGITHYALARREDLAKMLPPEDVTPENWWHWKSVCGKEIIAHVTDWPATQTVNCQRCIASLEKAKRTVAELRARFGDGL